MNHAAGRLRDGRHLARHSRHLRLPGLGVPRELAALRGQPPQGAAARAGRAARRDDAAAAAAGVPLRHAAQAVRQAAAAPRWPSKALASAPSGEGRRSAPPASTAKPCGASSCWLRRYAGAGVRRAVSARAATGTRRRRPSARSAWPPTACGSPCIALSPLALAGEGSGGEGGIRPTLRSGRASPSRQPAAGCWPTPRATMPRPASRPPPARPGNRARGPLQDRRGGSGAGPDPRRPGTPWRRPTTSTAKDSASGATTSRTTRSITTCTPKDSWYHALPTAGPADGCRPSAAPKWSSPTSRSPGTSGSRPGKAAGRPCRISY